MTRAPATLGTATLGTHPICGVWRLRSWESVAEGEAPLLPMGPDPEGLLVYEPDGTMTVLIGSRGRARFTSDDLIESTDRERSAALESFVAYGGSYEIDGETVVHRVEMSLFPNWVGTVQRRTFELAEDGEVLTLTSAPILVRGARRRQRLVWERVRRDPPGRPRRPGQRRGQTMTASTPS